MNKPKRQHTTPVSYLSKFCFKEDRANFVEAKNIITGIIKPISVKDICVSKDIYTFTNNEIKKYDLEDFYAKNIDAIYPEVYDLLTNPKIKKISNNEKRKIISTALSLYFRTPKFWNTLNRTTDQMIDFIADHASDNGQAKGVIEGEQLKFHISDKKAIKQKFHESNRLGFLSTHFKVWQEFVDYKIEDGLVVLKSDGKIPYITSDNPVTIRSIDGQSFNIFNPTNTIKLPIDNQHSLFIGRKVDGAIPNTIFRQDRDRDEVLVNNFSVEEQAEKWIIGGKGHIHQHIIDQEKYGAFTQENLERFEDKKLFIKEFTILSDYGEKYGIHHKLFISQVKKMRVMQQAKDDPQFQNLLKDLTLKGVPIF